MAQSNTDESKVPRYTLPDPLVFADGSRVATAADWSERRRPEVLELFRKHVYGRSPGRHGSQRIEFLSREKALDGKAIRKEIRILFAGSADGPRGTLLVYSPAQATRPVPVFVGLNFNGNHTVSSDPGISITESWVRNDGRRGITENRALEKHRGSSASRWPIELALSRGYAVATMYCGDVDPDFHDGFENGVHAAFPAAKRPADAWGTIAAWAWGLARTIDAFEADGDIDHDRVAVVGHSRLGKTALWAGAEDERFGLVVSNNSGCGGAALSRRRFGETVERINRVFPHWFCDGFKAFDNNEDALPVDQHMLVALAAPRAVYVASATGDSWADPRGEFLAAKHASPVYELLGHEGLPAEDMPRPDTPVQGRVGYHIRTGRHDITAWDWERYLDFADRHLGTTAKKAKDTEQ